MPTRPAERVEGRLLQRGEMPPTAVVQSDAFHEPTTTEGKTPEPAPGHVSDGGRIPANVLQAYQSAH